LHYTFILKILVQTRLAKAFTDASGKYDLSFELDKQAGISVKATLFATRSLIKIYSIVGMRRRFVFSYQRA
jgi:hypothetical protein